MLLKTYKRIIELFNSHHGYMNYEMLRTGDVTVSQMRELERENIIERFSRGWYWCGECGYDKPADYKYIEIAKVDPKAVICYDSACFLNGMLQHEPDDVKVATARTNRKKLELSFSVKRFYFSDMKEDNIIKKDTPFGTYSYYAPDRALCDSILSIKKIDPISRVPLQEIFRERYPGVEIYKSYIRHLIKDQNKEVSL